MNSGGIWKDRYLIGMPQIDAQHKQLLLTVGQLLNTLKKEGAAAKSRYRGIVAFLKDYVVVHFSTEELFQQSINYSRIEHHRALHQEFADSLHEFELRLIRTDYDLAVLEELSRMLTRWLIYHIMQEDKHMGNEAAEKGLLPK